MGYRGGLGPALRRVRGVRLVLEPDEVRAEVFGIGHRLPATVPVSLFTARCLVESGVRLVVSDHRNSEVALPA